MNIHIILNGEYLGDIINIEKDDLLYCADGGANIAKSMNIIPNMIYGDLDSISKDNLLYYNKLNIPFKIFNTKKDKIDFELILRDIKNYNKIFVYAGLGGRIDMELCNIKLLNKYQNMIFVHNGYHLFYMKNKKIELNDKKGKKLSIIPTTDIESLSIKGTEYTLNNKSLKKDDIFTVSNKIIENKASIKIKNGEALIYLEYN